jgi:hypothetical protein
MSESKNDASFVSADEAFALVQTSVYHCRPTSVVRTTSYCFVRLLKKLYISLRNTSSQLGDIVSLWLPARFRLGSCLCATRLLLNGNANRQYLPVFALQPTCKAHLHTWSYSAGNLARSFLNTKPNVTEKPETLAPTAVDAPLLLCSRRAPICTSPRTHSSMFFSIRSAACRNVEQPQAS